MGSHFLIIVSKTIELDQSAQLTYIFVSLNIGFTFTIRCDVHWLNGLTKRATLFSLQPDLFGVVMVRLAHRRLSGLSVTGCVGRTVTSLSKPGKRENELHVQYTRLNFCLLKFSKLYSKIFSDTRIHLYFTKRSFAIFNWYMWPSKTTLSYKSVQGSSGRNQLRVNVGIFFVQ